MKQSTQKNNIIDAYIETKNIQSKYLLEEIIKLIENNTGLEEIWISQNEKKYPCLAIQLNKDLACVNYFSENEEETNWTSLGNYEKEITFLSNGEEWTAPKDTIITKNETIECLKEFVRTNTKPTCIKWQKLI